MSEITLTIWTDGQTQNVPLQNSRLTIGRGEQADLRLNDQSLSRVHASVNRAEKRVWVLDEGSTNGTFVNGKKIDASGAQLKDGDHIKLGDATVIKINFAQQQQPVANVAHNTQPPKMQATASGISPLAIALAGCVIVLILAVAGGVAWKFRKGANEAIASTKPTPFEIPTVIATATPEPIEHPATAPSEPEKIEETAESVLAPVALTNVKIDASKSQIFSGSANKLYKNMSEEEQVYYVYTKAKEVALMIGNRPAEFPDEAIAIIKYWLDAYVRRIGTGNTRLWAEDLNLMFRRARTTFVPSIIRSFKANNAPPIVGLYLPVIETEYRNITTENFAGAAGLFQFIGPTARGYGVDPSERTNIDKMAPAAARYINDRLAEFGADAVGVGLSIAGYNRSPDSVRRDLHDVINSQNKDRDFWILVKNKSKLDAWFQRENINYPPRFFAAAIIGENPWNFGLKMRQLSTYTEPPKENEE